jgi:hypothetical protein
MTQYTIDIGAVPDDGQGDPLRTSFNYTNLNFDQIFAAGPVLSNVAIANNTIRTINSNGDLILAPNGIGRIQLKTSLVPSFDNVYELGSPTARFNTIYIGTGGLNIPSISVTGNITANYFIGNGSLLTGIIATDSAKISNGTSSISAGVTNGNITATINGVSNIAIFTNLGIVTNALTATGNVTANYFLGNGSLLTGVVATDSAKISNGTSSISAGTANGNITSTINGVSNVVVFTAQGLITDTLTAIGNVISGALVSGASLSASSATIYGEIATVSVNATGNIAGNNITATGDVNANNFLTPGVVSATGNVTGNFILGNGAFLTGVITSVSNISNGNSNIDISTANANITVGVSGNANIVVFANTGAYVTGVVSATGNITAPNFIGNVIGNISGNITVPGANTQVLFNDNGLANASTGFTFNKSSNLVTVGGNVSAAGFTGNGAGLANVMADRGGDPNNWNTLTQMGIYAVNRTSWAGTTGTPLDSQVYVGVLEVMNSGNTALSQVFYPGTTGADVKVQWTRNKWSGTWTAWVLMTNDGQVITGGDF